ncbi:hypothetical protein [Streptomyces sp. RerS4]|uniref:hypothetical protein n=1 Tax=Streptomyces sp. RerS4 TaxID=2942449 RepID=UPI00201C715F|nr:hypothetical protein [Streptomyces sp. RerS4]UQX01546.1 hypothetical protein M4D82_14275 [Streptomyces sp. RerS4]
MERISWGAVTGLLAALLLVAVVPKDVDRTAGRPHAHPGCQTVAFMSMTDVAPECR